MQQRLSSVLVLVAASLVVLLVIAAGLSSFFGKDGDEARPAADAPKAEDEKKPPDEVTPVKSGNPEIDLAFALPGSPQGIATNGQELVIGNRRDPWGVLRLVRDDDSFDWKRAVIREPRYDQKIDVSTLTWNGTHYVGMTSAAWFTQGADGQVFTVHDPKTLEVLSTHPAPNLVGCVAWDGMQYWAATRNHTSLSPDPALIYRIDRNFNVVSTSPAPGVGCQGLAWDGARLWIVDVFDDSIRVLDVSGPQPREIHRAFMNVEYLSGIVAFEGEIWVTDYENDRLQRIKPSSKMAWQLGATTIASVASTLAQQPQPAATATAGFDRDTNRFARRPQDDTELLDWAVAFREGNLVGEWKLWFGPDLFIKREQTAVIKVPEFARYEISIFTPDGRKTVKEYEAKPGENAMKDVVLAPAGLPGTYRVELFMHVQYVAPDAQGRILNHSAGSLEVRR